MLKAIIAHRTGECPPRLHNLVRLSELAAVELDESQRVLMEDLSRYYIQSRYAEGLPALARGLERKMVRQVLNQTEEVLRWLSSML